LDVQRLAVGVFGGAAEFVKGAGGLVVDALNQFGVRPPRLRAIARTPDLPEPVRKDPTDPPSELVQSWNGARLWAIEGQAYSAFGISAEDGGHADSFH
jgi:hypothetical protein